MSVATLERTESDSSLYRKQTPKDPETLKAMEEHNARIPENYRRLIGDTDVSYSEPAETAGTYSQAPGTPGTAETDWTNAGPAYMPSEQVHNVRITSPVFRADSPYNHKFLYGDEGTQSESETYAYGVYGYTDGATENIYADAAAGSGAESDAQNAQNAQDNEASCDATDDEIIDEGETEDSMPTPETIKYRTRNADVSAEVTEAAEEGRKAERTLKRDRLIVSTFICILIALVVLIVINSAVISSASKETASLPESAAYAASVEDEPAAETGYVADLLSVEAEE